jgi:hypothetical protein
VAEKEFFDMRKLVITLAILLSIGTLVFSEDNWEYTLDQGISKSTFYSLLDQLCDKYQRNYWTGSSQISDNRWSIINEEVIPQLQKRYSHVEPGDMLTATHTSDTKIECYVIYFYDNEISEYVYLVTQQAPTGLNITAVQKITPAAGETVYSVLTSADGKAATVAVSRTSALTKATQYFVYQGTTKLGPFAQYVQLKNKWEAYNGDNDSKSNRYIGTAKSAFSTEQRTGLENLTAIDDRILIDNSSDIIYDGTKRITIKHGEWAVNPTTNAIAYIAKTGNNTYSVVNGTVTAGPFLNAGNLTLSPDGKKIAYAAVSAANNNSIQTTVVVGENNNGTFITTSTSTSIVGEIVWSPDSTQVAFFVESRVFENPYLYRATGTLYAGTKTYGPYQESGGGILWSKDGKLLTWWAETEAGYNVYVNGERKGGPYRSSPSFLQFAFGDNTLCYVDARFGGYSDMTLYLGGESLKLTVDDYRPLILALAPDHPGFIYSSHGGDTDYHDSHDIFASSEEIQFTKNITHVGFAGYAPVSNVPYALGTSRGDNVLQTWVMFFNGQKKEFETKRNFNRLLISPSGKKYALIFTEGTMNEANEFFTCFDYAANSKEPKLLFTSLGGTPLPMGWTNADSFVYMMKYADGYYLISDDTEFDFGPYTSIADNGNKGISWAAYANDTVYHITDK